MQSQQTAFLFDLDGTLVDSVYQHVLAWREALEAEGIELSVRRIHRKIGMSGGLLTKHAAARNRASDRSGSRRSAATPPCGCLQSAFWPNPTASRRSGAACLSTETGIAWAIATSGRMETARFALQSLGVDCRGVRSLRATKSNMPNPIRVCFWPLRNGWGLGSRHRRSSATACGICWLLGEPARSASVFCRAATARKSWSAPAPIEFTQTRPTF